MYRRFGAPALFISLFALLSCSAWGAGTDVDALLGELSSQGNGRWGLMALIAISTLASEDLSCIAAGLLAAKGRMSPADAVLAGYAGILMGDCLIYCLGRIFGVSLLRKAPFRWVLSEKAVLAAEKHFSRRGAVIVFASRFLPGSRSATCFAAGALKQPASRFMPLFALAALAWTPLLVLGTMQIGRGIIALYGSYARWALPVLLALALVILFATRILLPLFTWRGRRLLLGRYKRITHWEYWPLYVTIWPTFFYILYLGFIKYRRPTLFTLANPGIPPDGGTIGESKARIYKALARAGDAILPWTLVPARLGAKERMEAVEAFMREHGLSYPIVLKSDEGQRSLGVKVIRNERAAWQYVQAMPGDTIAQAYCPGREYGVFYVRMPDEEHGKIISLTEKHITYVTGNGRDSLERLILADERAVCMAKIFLKRFEERLDEIPAAGEQIELVDIGTHAQGALFTDGATLETPELFAEIERITKCFDGFYFGRYDLRCPSQKDLQAGRNIRVIELNGVTGQCSHVYQPGYSVFYMWRTIWKQWSIAFEIGHRNALLGCKPMPKIAFIRHWRAAVHRQDKVRESIANAGAPSNVRPTDTLEEVELPQSVESAQ